MPIYFVIIEQVQVENYFYANRVVKSIPCTWAEVKSIYEREFVPLLQNNVRLQTMYFIREPENPIKEAAQHEGSTVGQS